MSTLYQKLIPNLVQKNTLILTQDLQLFLKLIQMNTLELKEYLEEQLIENPTLEEVETSVEGKETDNQQDSPDSEKSTTEEAPSPEEQDFSYEEGEYLKGYDEFYGDKDDDYPSWESRVTEAQSLLEYLNWQIELLDLTTDERQIASLLVGNIDEDGYLQTNLNEITFSYLINSYENGGLPEIDGHEGSPEENCVQLMETNGSYLNKVEGIMLKLQESLDPSGVCARDLAECLRIQARNLGIKEDNLIYTVIDHFLGDISEKNFKHMASSLDLAIEDVMDIASTISSLEPRPGRPFYTKDAEKFIVPDYFVYKVGNELQIQLNKDLPKIRINNYYRSLLKRKKELSSEAASYVKEKIEAARRIIKCLEERDQTIMKVLKEIIRVQRDFFEYGNDYIRPLRLKDVADAEGVGVHESTVSRITSKRYINTPQGTIELKSLFSRRIDTTHGAELSFERLKSIIRDIVDNEPKAGPYSDEDISKILARRNINVARRTIAKYRKSLDLPSSSQRAKIHKQEMAQVI